MVKHKPVLWVLVSPVLKISESYTPEDLLQPIVIDFFLIDNFFFLTLISIDFPYQ